MTLEDTIPKPFPPVHSHTHTQSKMAEIAAAAADAGRTVHLVSQEGESFEVPMDIAKKSELVKTMVDEEQDEDEAQEIPLPNVKSAILAKVIEFLQRMKVEPMTEIEKVNFSLLFLLSPSHRLFICQHAGEILGGPNPPTAPTIPCL